jgi:hypothetical protein
MAKEVTDVQWARTHSFGGRIVGEFISLDDNARPMVVLMTINGPQVAPRDSLIPLDQQDIVDSLAQRVEDLLDAAERVGYSPDAIQTAIEAALRRRRAG